MYAKITLRRFKMLIIGVLYRRFFGFLPKHEKSDFELCITKATSCLKRNG